MCGIAEKGRIVQPFKAGPDFIDSGLHKLAAGRTSRNLDLWMCGEAYVRNTFLHHGDADAAVIEGVMGLYDGSASTAALAGVLSVPVVLVIDGYGMAESAAPIIRGMREWGADRLGIDVRGVIFNRVASVRHYERLRAGVEGVTPLGYLPRDASFAIPHRHLGLVVAEEAPITPGDIDRLAGAVLEHIDIDALEDLSASTFPFSFAGREERRAVSPAARIAVASDAAFCFYYEDNIDLLREAGAEMIFFSPLADARLPAGIDAVYIGGGYPELYAKGFPPTLRCSVISARGARRPVPFMRNAAASCTSAGRYVISRDARSTPPVSSPSMQSWKRKAPISATARCSWMATVRWARKENASGATSSDIRTSAPMELQAGPAAYTASETDRAGRCRPRDTCARRRSQAIYTSISAVTSAYPAASSNSPLKEGIENGKNHPYRTRQPERRREQPGCNRVNPPRDDPSRLP